MAKRSQETVRAYYLKDGDEELACGKCKSIIYSDEEICPVCGTRNDINNAIHTTVAAVFPQV